MGYCPIFYEPCCDARDKCLFCRDIDIKSNHKWDHQNKHWSNRNDIKDCVHCKRLRNDDRRQMWKYKRDQDMRRRRSRRTK
jgi:hypothetical protein